MFSGFRQDSSGRRHWQKIRKGGLPPLSLPQAVSPASLSPPGLQHPLDSPIGTAHAGQSHAVDLTPDERSQLLGPCNDSCL